jgi:tetratricopeptide (TPR) repeat protein
VSVREVAPLILLASALAAASARAQPGPDEATRHFDRGAALAAEQKYDEAAQEFRASYELKARKESLFAWAQVLRLGGDCAAAVELYRKFLRSSDLSPTQIEAAQLSIDRCEAAPPRPVPPPVMTAPPPSPAPVAAVRVPPPPPVAARRSRGAVVAGATLLGGAVAALAASGTFFYLARGDERDAQAAGTWGEYYDPASRSRTRQRWGFGLLGAGILLGGGAVVEWLATAPARGTVATAWLGDGAAGVGLRGSY